MSALFDLSKVNAKYKPKRKRSKKSRRQLYADRLNKNLPKSEVWFQSKWKLDFKQPDLDLYKDKYNQPLGSYIPDVINSGYKYIIEIDGSIHETVIQKFKDKQKDLYYARRGYKVFRIKAYDEATYEECKQNILNIKQNTIRQY